jgi:methyl-accepting chemotaxis protein
MNEYLVAVIAAVITVFLCYLIVRLRSGNGLLSRFMSVAMPTAGAIALVAFVLGKQGMTLFSLSLALTVGVVSISLMVWIVQRAVVNKVKTEAEAVLEVASSLSSTSQETATSAEEQASAVAQVSSSIEEIHQMSRTTSDNSQQVVKAAETAESQGQRGLDSVRELLHVMERFAQTTDFVEVVGEVAEQSNLLAVNAGIEASKAGEYGRGFSVVAAEVRNLAEQSKESARQIRDAINQTKVGQSAISATDSVITGLASVLQETSDKARQISGAALQQSAGIKQISDAMGNLTQGGKDTALAAQQIERAGGKLINVSKRLTILISGKSSLTANTVQK